MNTNLPSVIMAAREAGMDETTAVGFAAALDRAGLLVDPTRTYGVVLHRRSAGNHTVGQWTPEPPTEVEVQARAWETSCQRAEQLAARIRAECGVGTGLLDIHREDDRLTVTVQVTDTSQWGQWRQYLGITEDTPHPTDAPYSYSGAGHRDGVSVWLTAYNAPQVTQFATAAARMPHRHAGVVYDLALPLRCPEGSVWDYAATRADGMPLLTQRGGSGAHCALADVVANVGPLSPMREAEPVPGIRQPLPVEVESEVSA